MAKIPEIALSILQETEKRIKKTEEDIKKSIDLKFQYHINRVEKLERNLKENKKDFENKIKDSQNQNIQILAIFIAIIGFLFGFMKFSTLPQLNFEEIVGLIILFGIVLYGFILLIHKLFSKP